MVAKNLDVVGIGNAIVDVLAHSTDNFLLENEISKGVMTLIGETATRQLYSKMENPEEQSGGSAANTIACIASMGGKCAFIGKVNDDAAGRSFQNSIRSSGILFETQSSKDSEATAKCLVLVTPDAQRTMLTYLGACSQLGPKDIDADIIRASKFTYLEGYLWDPEPAKKAFLLAAKIAHSANRKVALSLSDPFCVSRHRNEFKELIKNDINILFANEDEILSLYEVNRLSEAIDAVSENCELAAITRGSKGSIIVADKKIHSIDPAPVDKVLDTTGAGDAYAAGFLYGLVRDMDLYEAGCLGGVAAGEIITHMGGRPLVSFGLNIKAKL